MELKISNNRSSIDFNLLSYCDYIYSTYISHNLIIMAARILSLCTLVILAGCSAYAPTPPMIDIASGDTDVIVDTGMIAEPDPTPVSMITMSGALSDLVMLSSVNEWDIITSPLLLTGTAPGNWFFEATAPVTIVNRDWLIIGEWYITSMIDWMTTDIIPFSGSATFTRDPLTPYPSWYIILRRDNPSWEAINDAYIEIPVLFE